MTPDEDQERVVEAPGAWSAGHEFEVPHGMLTWVIGPVYARCVGDPAEEVLPKLREAFHEHHLTPPEDWLKQWARYIASKRREGPIELR